MTDLAGLSLDELVGMVSSLRREGRQEESEVVDEYIRRNFTPPAIIGSVRVVAPIPEVRHG